MQSRGLSPSEHLWRALNAEHPLSLPPMVPKGFAFAMACDETLGKAVVQLRLRRLVLLQRWIAEDMTAQRALAARAHRSQRHFATRPTWISGRILETIGSPDKKVAGETADGLMDWGSPPVCGVFPLAANPKTPLQSVSDLLKGAPGRNAELVRRLQRNHPHAVEVWQQGVQAHDMGALGYDISVAEVPAEAVMCFKFPVQQKVADGSTEIRACADASSGPGGNMYNET